MQKITPFLWFDNNAEEAAMLRMDKIDIEPLQRAYEGS
jgi:predicted 3-demethylubiquinone-9 3-methyltransferase (glyoxalase superfamily)